MPKAKGAKTASARKVPKRRITRVITERAGLSWLGAIIVIFGLATVSIWMYLDMMPRHVTINGQSYKLTVASSKTELEKGLGGRNSLPFDQGMLFVFARAEPQCMWMKDMRFSLDILWLNSKKQIIYVQPNISPSTYPKTFCANYHPAKYVIELNAGQAKSASINIGQTASF